VIRLLVLLSLFAVLLYSCGPQKPWTCSGEEPAFKVLLKLSAGPLPADTVVNVMYAGSGMEEYRLSEPHARLKVTFCSYADENGVPFDASAPSSSAMGAGGSAGAAGATSGLDDSLGVPALYCELWTAGYTELDVSGTGFMNVHYDLRPNEQCTVERTLVLDAPDAGS
jgi:hypothetical protein